MQPQATTAQVCYLPGDCRLVDVPGQKAWHTHVCPKCASSWTHIAPTPMTQGMNRHIHTCTKCGTLVYEFVRLDEQLSCACGSQIPWWGWVAGGALAAAILLRR
jgi:hypothetical protein